MNWEGTILMKAVTGLKNGELYLFYLFILLISTNELLYILEKPYLIVFTFEL